MTEGNGARRAWIPAMLADRYEVERELGAGAAAVTVAAQDTRLGRRVAIKVLRPEDEHDPAFTQRFMREARAAAAITHPNVVNVFDVGQEGELLYLVMQFVDGTDLKAAIQREGALPWPRAVEIARAVLAGLEPIHAAGIVHRDIKPQNVLIGPDGEVKVADFGVAHVDRDASLTAAGTTVGTAAYMAPEQAQGNPPTPAADVYAVGVMLYEMVTGRLPFDEPTAVATMLAHIQREVPTPAAPRNREALPAGLVEVILQALAKDPRERFASAAAMRQALANPERGGARARSAGRTTVAPVPPRRAAAPASQRQSTPARQEPPPAPGRGFGATFAMLLVLLALVFAAVAGGMWLIGDRPDLGGLLGADAETPVSTTVAPTPTPTPAPTEAGEAPVVIEPVEQDPTDAPAPTSTPTATTAPPTPTPTVPMVAPEPTVPPDSTTGEIPQIIEPIDPTEPAT